MIILTFIKPIGYAIVDDARHCIARYAVHMIGGAWSLAVVDVIVIDQDQRVATSCGAGGGGGACIVSASRLSGYEAGIV